MKRNLISADLPWTGERLVAGCGRQLIYEHVHRYAIATRLAVGKRAVDVACGEGYGANLLARTASTVVGIDLDQPTIEHANRKYRRQNLKFLVGSCEELPLESRSVDLVVSFETIEHVQEQEQFLNEIKRVLIPGGLLIISSPDKEEYSGVNGAKNPFHQSELYHRDFAKLLMSNFKECLIGKQRPVVGSWIAPDLPSPNVGSGTFRGGLDSVEFTDGVYKGLYSIAVCSDAPLPAMQFGIFENKDESAGIWNLFETYDRPEDISNLIAELRNEREQNAQVIAQLSQQVVRLEEAAEERQGALESLRAQFEERGEALERLQVRFEERSLHLQRSTEDLALARERFAQTHEQLQEKSISLAGYEGHARELTQRLCDQLSTTKKLSRLLVAMEEAAVRLRSSRRWQFANPMAVLRAKFSRDSRSAGYGHLEKIVSSYERWRASYPQKDDIDDQIQALKRWPLTVPKLPVVRRSEGLVVPAEPIRFPVFEKVEVSVIIPVFNQFHFTQACLASLQQHLDEQALEVIIVDDGSTDETVESLPLIEGAVYLRSPSNVGFVASCNWGATKARGKYLVFLNNDTTVTERWLSTLLDTFQDDSRAGLVGSKLIFPDGRLQEAGGIIWNDASGWNYGKFDDPGKPEYNFLREVDYCSAACVMISKALFEKVGGFELQYAPGYYEDTDLSFKVRRCGYKPLYQPLSEVIHFEGATGGNDLSTGAKRHQEVNRMTFAATWAAELAAKPAPGDLAGHFRSKPGQKRILVIDHHLPMPEKDSGSLRMFQILTILHTLGHRVTFIPDDLADTLPYSSDLRGRGIKVVCHPYIQSVGDYLREHGGEYDVVLLSRCDFAHKHIAGVRLHAPKSWIVFDTVDLHFLRDSREARLTQDPVVQLRAREKKEREYALVDQADETWVVSDLEQKLLQKHRPEKKIEVVTNIVEVPGSATPFSLRRNWLFIGSFQHTPNVDAVIYFVQEIYPLLHDRLTRAKFYIIGDKAPPSVVGLASENVIITGLQPDVRMYFESVRLSIAPLRWGAGVKGKINQSMSFGVPVVATSMAVEGMALKDREDVMIADDPAAFAGALVEVYESEQLWNRLSQNAIEKTKTFYSVNAARERLKRLFSEEHLGVFDASLPMSGTKGR
ncbi:MAG: methyltransferase domain-containing protein [Pyrinomonadaceae bacterium]|nr:methyltransferase domain-containing protein [Pyrinomonadaceae bacterium]